MSGSFGPMFPMVEANISWIQGQSSRVVVTQPTNHIRFHMTTPAAGSCAMNFGPYNDGQYCFRKLTVRDANNVILHEVYPAVVGCLYSKIGDSEYGRGNTMMKMGFAPSTPYILDIECINPDGSVSSVEGQSLQMYLELDNMG